jgi:hypothetical protein
MLSACVGLGVVGLVGVVDIVDDELGIVGLGIGILVESRPSPYGSPGPVRNMTSPSVSIYSSSPCPQYVSVTVKEHTFGSLFLRANKS